MKVLYRAVVLCAWMVCAGCVSQIIEPEHIPRVTTSQTSDGVVTLSWKSDVGYNYKIYIMSPDDRQWRPLKGVAMFRGTGDLISIQDQRNLRAPLPWYSVRAEKRK